jgi:hypothetical protein
MSPIQERELLRVVGMAKITIVFNHFVPHGLKKLKLCLYRAAASGIISFKLLKLVLVGARPDDA